MAQFVISAFSDEAGSSLPEQIAGLKRNGIRFTELRSVNDKNVMSLRDDELYAIKSELDKNGICVNSLGSPIGKYPITDDFEPHLAQFRRALDICHILGTQRMRMFSFFTPEDKLTQYRPEVMRRLKIMAEEASAAGITLCHENESKIYGQMPKEVLDILTEIPEIKGVFDGANYRMHDADTIEGIKATLTNFAYLHIKDAIYESKTVVPAGEGEAKLREVINAVDRHTDSEVFMTVEPHLRVFGIYKTIDDKELVGKYVFESAGNAFDFAVNALKTILTELGYKECCGIWKR